MGVTIKKVPNYRYGEKMAYSIRKNGRHIVFRDTKVEALKAAQLIRRMTK